MNITLAVNLADKTLVALSCINGNPDLSGIGVRLALYIQSAMNTLLVIVSPRDSVPSAWAGTLLTGSLVIAAIVQKAKHTITLHHAILIMNFATLSCISSLAVAPMLPIWRLRPGEYYRRELARHALTDENDLHEDEHINVLESGIYVNKHKRKILAAQNRERVVLSLALLTQVVLQWAWGIILFVSPVYSQKECSGDTMLVLFLRPFQAGTIKGPKFVVWPLWLLFSLGITLWLTIILALSSPNRAHDSLTRRSTRSLSGGNSSSTPIYKQLVKSAWLAIPSWNDRSKLLIFIGNTLSFALWCLYLASSEWQRVLNHIDDGENDFGGFGQVTAIFLALAPLWSLCVALYKYPSLRRRQERHRRRAMTAHPEEGVSQHLDESRGLLGHSPQPSGTAESFEMSEMGSPELLESSPKLSRQRTTSRRIGNTSVHVVTLPGSDTGLLNWVQEYEPSDVRH
ncbi:hypothetical protein QCA50_014524 [Cerrena zonata]|uniref:Uncharacterized protein n=1 Tax=Cerrena zonata TaxID=2478898 RepID=A0AAW0FLQ0_9APHY